MRRIAWRDLTSPAPGLQPVNVPNVSDRIGRPIRSLNREARHEIRSAVRLVLVFRTAGQPREDRSVVQDETFWGGLGQLALRLLATLMAALVAAPALLLLAAPFIG